MPLRYVLIAGLICAAIIFIKRRRYPMHSDRAASKRAPIRMVRCTFCGVHVASCEAVRLPANPEHNRSERYYCSLDHAKQDQLHCD